MRLANSLEFSAAHMRAMADAVIERCIEHIATVDQQPSCGDIDAAALCRALREPAPERGVALEPLLDQLFRDWIPRSLTTIGPGYLAYIPGGGIYPAALADFISNTTNRFTGVWFAAPALVQLEANALDWLRAWMGFPSSARGLFTTGGSMATFNAIVCARGPLAPRGRRVWSVFLPLRRTARRPEGSAARRFADARPTQGDVSAVRHRRAARTRRRGAARSARGLRGVPAGHAGFRRLL